MNINHSFSQKQINLDVDNDLYFDRDFYYSSGIFLSYTSTKYKEVNFFIDNFKLGQLIYTPSSRYETDPNKYDYPYSGYLFIESTRQLNISDYSSFTIGGNIGITGDASLAKGMQNLYHDIVLNLPAAHCPHILSRSTETRSNITGAKFYHWSPLINSLHLAEAN